MPKNIVVCCDGTGNEYGDRNTNVLKLYSILPKYESQQLAFYDPGVGTFSLPGVISTPAKLCTKLLGLGFGLGISQNIEDAYKFLMQTYEKGDRVFLFGFSRGAYTARAVAAMLYKCGLLAPNNESLVPYAMKQFTRERRPEIYAGFRRTFSRQCPVHFLGLWDTVKSVGWVWSPKVLQFTMRNPIVGVVRHAVAIDERRCFYRQNLWGQPMQGQDVKQVWFAGAHSDVGGSYPERESGLAQIALHWMVEEALRFGLLVERKRYEIVVPKEGASGELEGSDPERDYHAPPDFRGPIHRSLKGAWYILEVIPKLYQDPDSEFRKRIRWPRGKRRRLPDGALVHRSVEQRMQDPEMEYNPPNLPKDFKVEKTS